MLELMDPDTDADGLHPMNLGRLCSASLTRSGSRQPHVTQEIRRLAVLRRPHTRRVRRISSITVRQPGNPATRVITSRAASHHSGGESPNYVVSSALEGTGVGDSCGLWLRGASGYSPR